MEIRLENDVTVANKSMMRRTEKVILGHHWADVYFGLMSYVAVSYRS